MKKFIVFFLCVSLAACGTKSVEPDTKAKLVGTWEFRDDTNKPINIDFLQYYVENIKLAGEGKFYFNTSYTSAGFLAGTWSSPNNSHITFTADYNNGAPNLLITETESFSFDSKGRLVLTIKRTDNTPADGMFVLTKISN